MHVNQEKVLLLGWSNSIATTHFILILLAGFWVVESGENLLVYDESFKYPYYCLSHLEENERQSSSTDSLRKVHEV